MVERGETGGILEQRGSEMIDEDGGGAGSGSDEEQRGLVRVEAQKQRKTTPEGKFSKLY